MPAAERDQRVDQSNDGALVFFRRGTSGHQRDSQNRRMSKCFNHTDSSVPLRKEPYRYWKNLDEDMPSASRECARRIFAAAYAHYSKSDTPVISSVEAFYDRSESFLRHIHRDWTDKKLRRRLPFFSCLKTVAPVIAEDTPAVQAADMIAWCANRVKTESDPEIVGLCATVLNNRHVQILREIDAWYLQSHLSKLTIPDSRRIV